MKAQEKIVHDEVFSEFQHQILTTTLDFSSIPYQFGANTDEAVDCSSYVMKIYSSLGIDLARSTKDQVKDHRFETIPFDKRQTGDLIFFKNTYRRGVSHVGVIMDHDFFAHASTSSKQVVVDNLSKSSYFRKRLFKLRRLKREFAGQFVNDVLLK